MSLPVLLLFAEAALTCGLVLLLHTLRRRISLAPFYAALAGLMVLTWDISTSGMAVPVWGMRLLVGSSAYFTALLLGGLVVYVFDGPRAGQMAMAVLMGVGLLHPGLLSLANMQAEALGGVGGLVEPASYRLTLASVLAIAADLVVMAIAWEWLQRRAWPLLFRVSVVMLGVMWLDAVVYGTGAFWGTPSYLAIMGGTAMSRLMVCLFLVPLATLYLSLEGRRGLPPQRPLLAILQQGDAERRLGLLQAEISRRRQEGAALRQSEAALRKAIEDQSRAEDTRRRMERRLQRAARMESLELLAGGVAHDFNNLLVGILSASSDALDGLPVEHDLYEPLRQIEASGQQAAALTLQMLAYSGRGQIVAHAVDLSQLISSMGHLLQSTVRHRATLRYELSDEPCVIQADPAQIQQILLNLVGNAAEASAELEGREIIVRTDRGWMEAGTLIGAPTGELLQEGMYAWIEVEDNGPGVPAELRDRIFEPFFTTRQTGRGLGLAAAIGIIRGHSGFITLETPPRGGALFVVSFPCVDEVVQPAAPPQRPSPVRVSGAILVVDDDAIVRAVLRRILQRAGFAVQLAEDGEAGLAALAAQDVAVILLDLTMPGLSGRGLCASIQAAHPGIPLVLMSGFSEESIVKGFAEFTLAGFLQKPFTPGRVLEVIAHAMDPE